MHNLKVKHSSNAIKCDPSMAPTKNEIKTNFN